MAEEQAGTAIAEVPAAVTPVPAPNGHWKQLLAGLIGLGLMFCIVSQAGIAICCLWKPPQDWNLVNNAIKSLDTMAVLLAGGLIGLAKPGGG